VVAGAFEIIQGADGTDELNFEFEIVRVVNGSAAGQPFLYSGSVIASQQGN